jgi:Mn2+/Fe2+ NRAMP family transporter
LPTARSLRIILPGILVAATGVGAGDLATASIVGARIGPGIFWAILFGAGLKWVLNEGLARWQLASGMTLLEGWVRLLRLRWIMLVYLLIWAFAVGGALISACGVAGSALLPLGDDPVVSKRIWGAAHSVVGVALVYLGGFKLFERVMAVCIGLMFATVTFCAVRIAPTIDWAAVHFQAPWSLAAGDRTWVIGLIGGVGGTVTLMSYGYWIRETRREGGAGVRICRMDLAVGYAVTALFGIGMLLIGATTPGLQGKGAALVALLGERLGGEFGPGLRYLFLIGAWGAVFSSLLGVWQGVPYLFADLVSEASWLPASRRESADRAGSLPYNVFLLYLALPPLISLWYKFEDVQLVYTVLGACFMPLLAATLLVMNNRRSWVGEGHRSGVVINVLLLATLGFFLWFGWMEAVGRVTD